MEKGYFTLKELRLDSIALRGTFTGNRLKLFFKRKKYLYSLDDEVSIPEYSRLANNESDYSSSSESSLFK